MLVGCFSCSFSFARGLFSPPDQLESHLFSVFFFFGNTQFFQCPLLIFSLIVSGNLHCIMLWCMHFVVRFLFFFYNLPGCYLLCSEIIVTSCNLFAKSDFNQRMQILKSCKERWTSLQLITNVISRLSKLNQKLLQRIISSEICTLLHQVNGSFLVF